MVHAAQQQAHASIAGLLAGMVPVARHQQVAPCKSASSDQWLSSEVQEEAGAATSAAAAVAPEALVEVRAQQQTQQQLEAQQVLLAQQLERQQQQLVQQQDQDHEQDQERGAPATEAVADAASK